MIALMFTSSLLFDDIIHFSIFSLITCTWYSPGNLSSGVHDCCHLLTSTVPSDTGLQSGAVLVSAGLHQSNLPGDALCPGKTELILKRTHTHTHTPLLNTGPQTLPASSPAATPV